MELNKSLPGQIKLFNFAKKENRLSGLYRISDFPKISEIANNKRDKVVVDLSFYLKNNKTPCVEGIIKLDILVSCQRCLDNLSIPLKININLAFVKHNQESEELDSDYDIYLIEEEELATNDLISDEILLSIPMVPVHDYDCKKEIIKHEIIEEKSENPFDILKKIKIADGGKE